MRRPLFARVCALVVLYHFADTGAVADEVRLFRGPINYP
jgi:hypothetical protein